MIKKVNTFINELFETVPFYVLLVSLVVLIFVCLFGVFVIQHIPGIEVPFIPTLAPTETPAPMQVVIVGNDAGKGTDIYQTVAPLESDIFSVNNAIFDQEIGAILFEEKYAYNLSIEKSCKHTIDVDGQYIGIIGEYTIYFPKGYDMMDEDSLSAEILFDRQACIFLVLSVTPEQSK